jgi:ATP phosphoribosyltransferase regulatory subunit
VIRVRGNALKPERQFAQVGTELIGVDSAEADAEAVLLSVDALRAIGVSALTVDLNLPTLVAAVVAGLKLEPETAARLRHALDRKDEAAIAKALAGKEEDRKTTNLFVGLLRAAGPAPAALARLGKLTLPDAAAAEAGRLAEVVALVRTADPELPLTLDAVDYRGLEYQTGVSFAVFSLAGRQELARGGRYSAGYPEDGISEPATGFTLYMDAVLAASQRAPQRPRLFLPAGTPWSTAGRWQAKGYAVVRAVTPAADFRLEAKRLGCTHALIDEGAVPL